MQTSKNKNGVEIQNYGDRYILIYEKNGLEVKVDNDDLEEFMDDHEITVSDLRASHLEALDDILNGDDDDDDYED